MLDNIMSFYRKLDSIKEGHLLYAMYDTEARETKEKLENFLKTFFETKDEPGFSYIASFKEFMNVVAQYQTKLDFIVKSDPSAKQFLDEVIKIIKSGNLQNAVSLLTTLKKSSVNIDSQVFFENLKKSLISTMSETRGTKRKDIGNGENANQISGYAGSIQGHWSSTQIPLSKIFLPILSTDERVKSEHEKLRPESQGFLNNYYTEVLNKLNSRELIDFKIRTDVHANVDQVSKIFHDTTTLTGLKSAIYVTIHTYLTYLITKKENFIPLTSPGHQNLELLLIELFNQYPALNNVRETNPGIMSEMLEEFQNIFDTNSSFRQAFYSQGHIVKPGENSTNNNNNAESATSFAPIVKSKTAREVKAEMLQALSEKIVSSKIKTTKEAMDFVKQYVKDSPDIKADRKVLALLGMDKEVERLLKEVKPEVKSEVVSNANISLQQ